MDDSINSSVPHIFTVVGLDDEEIYGKHLFWVTLPETRPPTFFGRLMGALGYTSIEGSRWREARILAEANKHIYETVIRDRKSFLAALKIERNTLGKELGGFCEKLERENKELAGMIVDLTRVESEI